MTRRVLSWIARSLAVLLVFVLSAITGLLIWLQTPAARVFLAEELVYRVNQSMEAGRIDVGDLRIEPRRLILDDVLVLGQEHPVARIDKISVGWSLAPLIQKTIRIRYATIQDAHVTLYERGGGYDLPRWPEGDSQPDSEPRLMPGAWELELERLGLYEAAIWIEGFDHNATGLDLVGSGSLDARTYRVEDLTLQANTTSFGPIEAQLEANGSLKQLSDLYLKVQHADSTVEVSGSLAGLDEAPRAWSGQAQVVAQLHAMTTSDLASLGGSVQDVDHPPTRLVLGAEGSWDRLTAELDAWLADDAMSPPILHAEGSIEPEEAPMPVTLSLEASDLSIAQSLGGPALQGSASADLEGMVSESGKVQATGTISVDDAGTDTVVVRDALLAVDGRRASEGTLAIDGRLDANGIRAGETRLASISGPIDLQVRPGQAPQVMADLRLSNLRAANGQVALARMHTDAWVELSSPPTVDADARLRGLSLADQAVLGGPAAVTLRVGRLAARIDLEEAAGPRRITARATGDVETGRYEVGDLTLRLVEDVRWTTTAPARFTVADGGVRDVHLALEARGSESSKGRITVDAPTLTSERLQGTAVVRGLDLEPVRRTVAQLDGDVPAFSGHLDAGARFDLSPGAPAEGEAELRLSLDEGRLDDKLVRVGLDLRAGMSNGLLTAAGVLENERSESALVNVDARLPIDLEAPRLVTCGSQADLAVVVPPFEWSGLRRTLAAAEPLGRPLQGHASLKLSGDPCVPSMTLRGEVRTEQEGQRVVANVDGTIDDSRLDVAVNALVDGAQALRVTTDTDVPMRHLRWFIQGAALPDADTLVADIGRWTARVDPTGLPLSLLGEDTVAGEVIGTLDVRGTGASLTGAEGQLQLRDARVQDLAIDHGVLNVHDEGDTVAAQLDVGFRKLGSLELTVQSTLSALTRGPTQAPFILEIDEGRFPLAVLGPLTGGALTNGDGVVELSGDLSGTIEDPSGALSIQANGAELAVAELGVRYTDIQLDAAVSNGTLVVDDAVVVARPRYGRYALESEDHTLQLSGRMDLTGPDRGETELEGQLDRFWVIANDLALIEASGEVAASGSWPEIMVESEIEVDTGRLSLPPYLFESDQGLTLHPDYVIASGQPWPDPSAYVEGEANVESPFMQVDIEGQIDLRDRVQLDATVPLATSWALVGDIAELEARSRLGGRLRIDKNDSDLDIGGRIETEQGSASLLSARFEINQGTIAFAGEDYTSPNINLALERETDDYGTVSVRVTGTPDQLEITQLSSDTYTDQADVLALIMFGRPLSELSSEEGQVASNVVQNALINVAGERLADAVGTQVADTISYDAASGLSVGWALTSDVFFTIEVDPQADEDENTTEAQLSWFLGGGAEAELESGDAGESAGWLFWERRF